MATYTEISVENGQATVEFFDEVNDVKHTRQINVYNLTEEQKIDRYESHLRTFNYRIELGTYNPPTVQEVIEPEE
jgi:hypothetical protein